MAEDVELGNVRKRAKLDHTSAFSTECSSADREEHDSSSIRLNEIELNGQRNEEEGGRTDEEIPDTSKSSSDVILYESPENSHDGSDDDGDSSSDASDLSDLSDVSEHVWRGTAGPLSWVQKMIEEDKDPRTVLSKLMPGEDLVEIVGFPDVMLWKLIINILSEPPRRSKLSQFNTIDDVVELMRTCQRIIVLTGAGVSVSCGIPDFRSRDGVYARLAVDFPDLPDPQAMFDIVYFRNDQRPFFKFAKEIYPGQFEPSKAHKFIRMIEQHGKLLRNYTQNIDTLEQQANIHNVIQCHGSFATATCMSCGYKVDAEYIREDIMNQVIPRCPKCVEEELVQPTNPTEPQEDPTFPCEPTEDDRKLNVLKPDIVFFGESLPDHFHSQMAADKEVCDLLIVIGSSLKVRPVALIPNSLPAHIPQVLINREPLKHLNFDVELLGDCDVIVSELCRRLGPDWYLCGEPPSVLEQVEPDTLPTPPPSPVSVDIRHHRNLCSPSRARDPMIDNSEASNMDTRDAYSNSGDNCASKISDTLVHSTDSRVTEAAGPSDLPSKSCDLEVPQFEEDMEGSLLGSGMDLVRQVNNSSLQGSDSAVGEGCASDSAVPPNSGSASEEHQDGMLCDTPGTAKADGDSSSSGDGPHLRQKEDRSETDQAATGSSYEIMKQFWKPKVNLASGLGSNQFLFKPPCRYVFHGAEVYVDPDSDSEEEEESKSKGLSDNEEEQDASMEQDGSGAEQARSGVEQDMSGVEQDGSEIGQGRSGAEQDRSGAEQDRSGAEQDRSSLEQDKSGMEQITGLNL